MSLSHTGVVLGRDGTSDERDDAQSASSEQQLPAAAGTTWPAPAETGTEAISGELAMPAAGAAAVAELTWTDIGELLQGRGPLAARRLSGRPPQVARNVRRQIFVERPVKRRQVCKMNDKWFNSGGKTGSTTRRIGPTLSVRKRYGRCVPSDGSAPLSTCVFSLLSDGPDGGRESKAAVFVVENPRAKPPCSGSADADDTVLTLCAEPHHSRFVSFQAETTRGQTFELGSIVRGGQGVKLLSGQGDFAEWHPLRSGELPFEE